jgi:hypothetical protein
VVREWKTRRLTRRYVVALVGLLGVLALYVTSSGAVITACANPTLSGSNFEIDASANFRPNGGGDCIDWLAGSSGTNLRSGVISKDDKPTGSGDDSFGQGTSEDDDTPTIVDGSIPPQKSDLKKFGIYQETSATGKFLELFWTRINSPNGTTNMDFELNQKFCDLTANPTNCADNGNSFPAETPIRTSGDKLITYDLSKGGTVPTISIRTWGGSAWGPATVISGGQNPQALGSVNTSTIASTDSPTGAAQDPYTFGEASLNFSALFPSGGTCNTFGSAYLKSRSSDSFNSELKDFIGPERVNISNCTTLTTNATASATIGSPISDTATLAGATTGAGGTITFNAYGPNDANCTGSVAFTATVNVSGNGNYSSGNFTPTQVGTYRWTASYSGDLGNAASSSPCNAANEVSVVNKRQPSISTLLSDESITVGDSIHDTATLSGASSDAGGTVTYTVYSNNACTAGAVDAGTKTVTNGVVPNSNSIQFNSVGTFYWQAVYSGDAKNETATSVCTSEVVTVAKQQPSISTVLSDESITVGDSIHDTATLSNATADAGGTVTYTVYSNNSCNAGARAAGTKTVTNGIVPNSDSIQFNSVGTFYWQAVYSGDTKNETATSVCTSEVVTVGPAASGITTNQKVFPNDSATVTGTTGGVTFELFGPFTASNLVVCTAPNLKFTQVVAQGSGGVASTTNYPGGLPAGTNPFAVDNNNEGWYGWKVTAAADATHVSATSDCTEKVNIAITD